VAVAMACSICGTELFDTGPHGHHERFDLNGTRLSYTVASTTMRTVERSLAISWESLKEVSTSSTAHTDTT
jgi:hypothetical protein